MGRLIDADELMRDIVRRFGCKPYIEVGNKYEYVHEIINEQPTAFDVDNIVTEIEEMFGVDPMYYGAEARWAVDKAIDIVKRGGIDG